MEQKRAFELQPLTILATVSLHEVCARFVFSMLISLHLQFLAAILKWHPLKYFSCFLLWQQWMNWWLMVKRIVAYIKVSCYLEFRGTLLAILISLFRLLVSSHGLGFFTTSRLLAMPRFSILGRESELFMPPHTPSHFLFWWNLCFKNI